MRRHERRLGCACVSRPAGEASNCVVLAEGERLMYTSRVHKASYVRMCIEGARCDAVVCTSWVSKACTSRLGLRVVDRGSQGIVYVRVEGVDMSAR